MRFLILTLNYAPEPTGFAPHATAFAEHLAARGHIVQVLTGFPFAPRWQRWDEYRGRFTETQSVNGVALTRLSHFIPRRPGSLWQRLLMEGTFCAVALWHLLLHPPMGARRPDAIQYIGAQPSLALLSRLIGRLCAAPYFVNINDIASDAARDVGIVRRGMFQSLLSRVERAAYQRAAGATVLCGSFSSWLQRHGFDPGHIEIIRSPIDVERIRPVTSTGAFRQAYGIPAGRFVVLFAGSMGLKQGLENIVEAAAIDGETIWVLVGDGETRPRLERMVAARALGDRVRFVPFQPVESMSAMFADADVLLLNQLSEVKDTVVPSKLLTYMAAGRPIVAALNARSQGAEILEDAGGGVLVEPENPARLCGAVARLRQQDPRQRAESGARNRRYAEQHFDSRVVLGNHERFILEKLAPSKPA